MSSTTPAIRRSWTKRLVMRPRMCGLRGRAGNSGLKATVYPAALKNVIDVASTSNTDRPSTFSNYGAPPVWLAVLAKV